LTTSTPSTMSTATSSKGRPAIRTDTIAPPG
jgi:hypothetical protein